VGRVGWAGCRFPVRQVAGRTQTGMPLSTERVATPRVRATPAAPPPRRPATAVAGPPRRPATPRPVLAFNEPSRRRPRMGVIAAALLGLAVVAAAVVVVLSSGSSPTNRQPAKAASTGRTHRRQTHATTASRSSTAAASTASTASTTSTAAQSTPSSTSTPAASTPPSTPTSAAGDPVSAVKSFYTLAAAHRYGAAWGLADASMQGQLGGYRSFQSGQAGDRSITFTSARTVSQTSSSARVAITTTSVRTNGTQQCSGTVDLVPGVQSGQWQLHQIGRTAAEGSLPAGRAGQLSTGGCRRRTATAAAGRR
jgi:hypothetical protein